MNDTLTEAVLCAECAYWRQVQDSQGTCHRRAPEASPRSEEIAHWPQTRATQGCGDGARAPSRDDGVTCGDCVFWRRPAHGLSPTDRGDMLMSWWSHAGYCGRHAPQPASEPGVRAFWRATSSADGCGEGAPRRLESAAG
ncbi:MAG: hypothetical protein KGL35_04430 [Bradyrhizobium sp.]|nr:hypothetical protein [Bradyrhizobium sp.]